MFLVKDYKKNISTNWEIVVLVTWEKVFSPAYGFDTENYP